MNNGGGGKWKFGKGATGPKFNKFDNTSKVEDVKCVGAVGQGGATMGLCFHVTDVRRPVVVVAVKRIAEKDNCVQVGPSENHNFIKNRLAGHKIISMKKGGSCIMDVSLCRFPASKTGKSKFRLNSRQGEI